MHVFAQVGVEFADQQVADLADLAQRLLQVVRGDVGELLQVPVGPGELLGLDLELVVDPLDLFARLADLGLDGSSTFPDSTWDAPPVAAPRGEGSVGVAMEEAAAEGPEPGP